MLLVVECHPAVKGHRTKNVLYLVTEAGWKHRCCGRRERY